MVVKLEKTQTALPEVLVFGGTSEGRSLAEWLAGRGSCSLVGDLPNVKALTGRLVPEQMEALMRSKPFVCVIDATHPYAAGVSESIARCAEACGLPLYRVIREAEPEGPWTGFDSAEQAASYLAQRPGKVLLTTGSKDLATYVAALPDYRDRLYVRILPVAASIAAAASIWVRSKETLPVAVCRRWSSPRPTRAAR